MNLFGVTTIRHAKEHRSATRFVVLSDAGRMEASFLEADQAIAYASHRFLRVVEITRKNGGSKSPMDVRLIFGLVGPLPKITALAFAKFCGLPIRYGGIYGGCAESPPAPASSRRGKRVWEYDWWCLTSGTEDLK